MDIDAGDELGNSSLDCCYWVFCWTSFLFRVWGLTSRNQPSKKSSVSRQAMNGAASRAVNTREIGDIWGTRMGLPVNVHPQFLASYRRIFTTYPLVNVYITMEHHNFQWENPLFQWPFSIAFCMFTRGYPLSLLQSLVTLVDFSGTSTRDSNQHLGTFSGDRDAHPCPVLPSYYG